jgi:hypothetical protein
MHSYKIILSGTIIVLLLSLVMFLSLDCFVDNKVTSKWYAFVLLSSMGGLLSLFDQDHKITVDRTLVMLILFLSYLLIRQGCR